MRITLHTIPIGEVVKGFANNDEEGVVGYGGKLNIRPKYQREFVYDEKQKIAVIDTIFKGFPLNVMYWVKNEDGSYELLDGQQRTLSFCSFYAGEFSTIINDRIAGFGNLTQVEMDKFLTYPLQVYICEDGTDKDRLDWFNVINIAGEKLTAQELRNATYTGQWVTEAKKKFAKSTCVAKNLGEKLMSGRPIRQEYLETVLRWMADKDNVTDSSDRVAKYMSLHQHDKNADREWQYFQQVVAWVRSVFVKERKEMKGLEWGLLYNRYKNNEYSATEMEERVKSLMEDEDVTNKKGIYEYLLSGEERCLSIRTFTDKQKREAYERQQGVCPICGKAFAIEEMEADHITPWSEGGTTTADNCQMLCKRCNRVKSNH